MRVPSARQVLCDFGGWHTINDTVIASPRWSKIPDGSKRSLRWAWTKHSSFARAGGVLSGGAHRSSMWPRGACLMWLRVATLQSRASGLLNGARSGSMTSSGRRWICRGPYRLVFDTMVPNATQVADPFHVVKLANQKLDEVRRRVQNETLGHRGHKNDPLYRCRRLLTRADERLDARGRWVVGGGELRSRSSWGGQAGHLAEVATLLAPPGTALGGAAPNPCLGSIRNEHPWIYGSSTTIVVPSLSPSGSWFAPES